MGSKKKQKNRASVIKQGLEGYFRDSGFDQNTVRESGKTINVLTGSGI